MQIDAGARAEELFVQEMNAHEVMVERIDQSQAGFKQYTASAKAGIKRGDFLLRNVRHLEVEVKCLKLRSGDHGDYFMISEEDWCKHQNMLDLTASPDLLFAIYENVNDHPREGSLLMASMAYLKRYEQPWQRASKGMFFIPTRHMKSASTILDAVREERRFRKRFKKSGKN